MICSLCKKDRELRNSHIIPEFIYAPLYDKNRFNVLSVLEHKPRPFEQKGLREKLLCQTCETALSKVEKYGSKVLFGGIELDIRQEGKLILIDGFDYKKFKIFLLSILWRAGVAKQSFFDQVSLGPHENILREMILNNNPGARNKYGILAFVIMHESKVQSDLILQPTWTRIDGHYCYRFVFGGFLWVYFISDHNIPQKFEELFISDTGHAIFIMSNIDQHTKIIDFAKQLKQLGRLNN